MATEVASLFATLRLADDQFRRGMGNAQDSLRAGESGLSRYSRAAMSVGTTLTTSVTMPLLGVGVAAVTMGTAFDENMTNARAVMGMARGDSAALTSEILRIGMASRYGPTVAAEAFYDIVSGVQGADRQMVIFNEAIRTAEAGNADLAATTGGLVSIVNAYNLSAEEAAGVSDVLTTTVNLGIGSMDQFTAALGPAAALSNSLGIGFEDLASNTAYLTTTGISASMAVTQLTGIMSAFLKPNTDMTAALAAMGYSSGTAAIEAEGLQGAVSLLFTTLGSTDAVAQALGTQEALGGAIGLNTQAAQDFSVMFTEGLTGATDAARAIQMESAAAQFDLLKSSLEGAGISISGALLPPLVAAAQAITPLIKQVATANPALIQMGVAVAAVAASIGPLAVGVGLLLSPIGLLVTTVGLLGAAYVTNFGGFRDFVTNQVAPVVIPVFDMISAGVGRIAQTIQSFAGDVQTYGVGEAIAELFGKGTASTELMESSLVGIMTTFGMSQVAAYAFVDTTWAGFQRISAFTTDTAVPAIQGLWGSITDGWATVQPHLAAFGLWFTTSALPMASAFVTETAIPAIQGLWGSITDGWVTASTSLGQVYDWFAVTALPTASAFVTGTFMPGIETAFNFLAGTWMLVSAGLTPISDWFTVQGGAIVGWLTNATDNVLTAFSGWFTEAGPYVLGFWTMFSDNVTAAVNTVTGLIDGLIAKINSIPAVGNIGTGAAAVANIGASGASRDVIWNAIAAEFGWGRRAEGGPVMGGSAYLVGERGPELFVPQGNGTIVPNGAGGGGMNVNVQLTVTEGNARNAGLSFAEGLMDRYRALA